MMHHYAPLLEGLLNYTAKKNIPFHMPGHKQGRSIDYTFALAAGKLLELDLTEVPGLDNLHAPQGIIAEAQELAAHAFKAEQSFFLVNGTTCGIQALILALCNPNDEIIIPRHVHISVLEGIILSGAKPVFIEAEYHPDGYPLTMLPEKLVGVLDEHPKAKGVLLVHPTYYGIASELSTLVKICHSRNKVVLVDEAHGAHFSFHQCLPLGAMEAGADAAVQSTHKILGSLTQTSMLHIQGERLDRGRVKDALSLLQSTSPSYLLMASLDGARRQMALEGKEILTKVINLAQGAREELKNLSGISVLAAGDLKQGQGLDPLKILVKVSGLGITGFEGARVLADEYGIQLEMADSQHLLAMYTIGTTEEDSQALVRAIKAMVKAGLGGPEDNFYLKKIPVRPRLPQMIITPREAWFASAVEVPLQESIGRVAARAVTPYPPGTADLWPGERISKEMGQYLMDLKETGTLGELGKPLKVAVIEGV